MYRTIILLSNVEEISNKWSEQIIKTRSIKVKKL